MNSQLARAKESAFQAFKQLRRMERKPIRSSWRPPPQTRVMSQSERQKMRNQTGISVIGNVCSPISSYEEMRFPRQFRNALQMLGFSKLNQVLSQTLPAVLLGRDVISVALNNQENWFAYLIPAVINSLQRQLESPLYKSEGPLSLILMPSQQLAIQMHQFTQSLVSKLKQQGYPGIRCSLCIGGKNLRQQADQISQGVHIIFATPGRISHLIDKKEVSLDQCRLLAMDQAQNLLNQSFQKQLRKVLRSLGQKFQVVLCCGQLQKGQQEFCRQQMRECVVVRKVHRNYKQFNVIQQVEYVRQQQKIAYLLEVLKRTRPKVVIFCQNKFDCDQIERYLSAKNIKILCSHAGKTQIQRSLALSQFKEKGDVLVCTSAASRTISFRQIFHVINFETPREIQTYIERVALLNKTDRFSRSTTFINRNQDLQLIISLKKYLIESNQYLPNFLKSIGNK